MVYALAKEPGPTATDVAIGYELAWDHLDFGTLWALSGPELRDGLDEDDFIAAKRAAYAQRPDLQQLAGDVRVDESTTDGATARVVTRLVLRDGSMVSNEVRLARRDDSWKVVTYTLQSTDRV